MTPCERSNYPPFAWQLVHLMRIKYSARAYAGLDGFGALAGRRWLDTTGEHSIERLLPSVIRRVCGNLDVAGIYNFEPTGVRCRMSCISAGVRSRKWRANRLQMLAMAIANVVSLQYCTVRAHADAMCVRAPQASYLEIKLYSDIAHSSRTPCST